MWAFLAAFLLFQPTPDHTAEGSKALQEGKYEAAIEAFTKAVAADAGDYYAHFNLGQAYGLLHRNVEGIAEYRKVLELKPGLYEAEINEGILLMRQREPGEALPLLAQAAAQKPQEYLPRYSLAVAQYQTGSLEDAEASYRRALEIDSKSAAAESGLAHTLARLGKLGDAAPHFERAAELDPQLRPGLLELAELYEQNGQKNEAAAIYRGFPDRPDIQERLGRILLDEKQYKEALPRLEAAYAASPSQASRLPLAEAYVFSGQIEKALPLLQQASAAEPGSFDIRMMYGRALRIRRQYAAAAAQFVEAGRAKPKEPRPWTEAGAMYYMTASYEQSLAAFDRARQLGEDTPGVWFMRALNLDRMRQLKPALEAYRQFLAMSHGNPDQEFQARQRARIIQHELERR